MSVCLTYPKASPFGIPGRVRYGSVQAPSRGPAFVSSVSKSSPDNGNITTAGIDTRGANFLVAAISGAFGVTIGITDSKSNTWSTLTVTDGASGASCRLLYSNTPTTDAAHTFTVTSSGTCYPSIAVLAFSNVGAFESQTVAPSAVQPGSLTPAENNALLVAAAGYPSPDDATAINSGFVLAEHKAGVPSFAYGVGMAYLIQSTATAANPTWTGFTGGACVMAVFKPV